MVNFSKPLTYESLKTVLQYLEPNKRFQVSQKCSTIRVAEKLVPLKIDSLTLCEQKMMVNDTAYQIGSYRKYPDGVEIPRLYRNENENGGTPYDLDEFGAPQWRERLQPGDLLLMPAVDELNDEERINRYQGLIDFISNAPRQGDSTFAIDQLADIRINLQDLFNRRDNIPASFETMTAFTVTSGKSEMFPYGFWVKYSRNSGNSRMELFTKSMPTHKAMKHLLNFMFDGRQESVKVKKLAVPQYTNVLRLPLGLKFGVRELEVNGHDMSVLATIIDEKSYPLALLETYKMIETFEDISHPLESTARKLILSFTPYNQLIARLSNNEIFLKDVEMEHLQLLFGEVLRHWTTSGRELGSSFTFDVNYIASEEYKNWIMGISSEFNRRRIDETTIVVPLNYVSEIRVIHRKLDDIIIEDEDCECGLLRIEVASIAMEH